MYYLGSDASNKPTGSTDGALLVMSSRNGATWVAQLYRDWRTDVTWTRKYQNSVGWSSWLEIGALRYGAITASGTLDWNDATNTRPGTSPTLLYGDASNGPGLNTFFHVLNYEYDTKDGTGSITQFAIPYGNPTHINSGMYMRGRYSGSWSAWKKIWSEVNDGSGSGLDADLLDGSHKADICKLSAMATVKLDGNTEVSANNETVVNIEDYSAEHKFFQLSAYGPLINMTAKICYGAKVTAAEAVEACEHVVIVRNRASSYEELYLINGSTNAITFYYKVYKYTE